jgi:hypothetical protein
MDVSIQLKAVNGARSGIQQGYPDADIISALSEQPDLAAKISEAKSNGYSDTEIVNHVAHIKSRDELKAPDPTEGMSGYEKFTSLALGMAVNRAGQGIKQLLLGSPYSAEKMAQESDPTAKQFMSDTNQSIAEHQADIDETKRLDAPLDKTGMGKVGNVAGNIAMAVPTAFVPGANTYTGSALVGLLTGAVDPTSAGESRVQNMLMGAAGGVAGQAIGKGVARLLFGPAKSALTPEAAELAQKAGTEGIPLNAADQTGSKVAKNVNAV